METSRLVSCSHNSKVIRTSGNVTSDQNCGITFINIGNDTVTVMGYPLSPSYQLYLPANLGEYDTTNYTVTFAGVGNAPQLLVITRVYN